MAPVVSIRKVAEELDGLPTEATAYFKRQTGEVYTVTEVETSIAERAAEGEELNGWEREALPLIREVLESGDWLPLPSRHDIHERSIMHDFCYSISDAQLQEKLREAIHSKKAFGHFKDFVYRHGLEDQWYAFKANALEQIVVDWLDQNAIAYTQDDRSPSTE